VSDRRPAAVLAAALRRGAPPRRTVARAIGVGALAQLAGVALVGGATALLTWSASRPGLSAVAGLLVAVEVVAFLRAPLRHAERVSAHDLGLGGLSGWRTWLLDSVSTWSPSRLGAARSGDLLARCLGDADRLQDLWVRVLVPASSSLLALVVASALLAIAVPAAGVAVLVASAAVAAATWLWADTVARHGIAEAELRGTIAARVVELAHRAESLSLLGATAHHKATTLALVRRCDELAARRRSIVAALGVIAALCAAGAVVAAAAAVRIPTSSPALSAGVLLATLACGELLAAIPSALEPLGTVAGAAARLGTLEHPVPTGTTDASRGPLSLEHVDVAAAPGAAVLLHEVAITVPVGAEICVVGPTGSGKSSLLAVAARLEPPRAGRVTLAEVDVDELDEASLRRAVGWLPTHPGLLDGRVRDVLDLGRGHSDGSLLSALERVGLGSVLAPRGGLEAVIGARGDGLSAGELRRLALARLLAGEPDLYLLDEPTAGLDDTSCALVLAALDASGAGVLVATHDERVESWATTTRTISDGALT
jgi:ABC-type transport system involved in cytochrome bd biosynthesis fused ATPase/permease subunit